MSLEHVAAAADIDAAHLSRVERGMASLSVGSLARLARVLGLTELAKLLAPYARGSDSAPASRGSCPGPGWPAAHRGGGGHAA